MASRQSVMPAGPDDAHVWVTAAGVDPETVTASPSPASLLVVIDAHRRHRGPYTAAGALLREIVPEVVRRRPDLVVRHDLELLTAAPELEVFLPCNRTTLTWGAAAGVTRRPRCSRTARIAHGLVDFLTAWLGSVGRGRQALVVQHAASADATDAELMAILLRRVPPSMLRLVVCAGADAPADLRRALERHAVPGPAPPSGGSREHAGVDPRTLAARYVAGDCTSEDLGLRAAYDALPAGDRARLHDLRADVLESEGALSLRLGAIPFHREHGRDPIGAGVPALRTALEHCMRVSLHEAAVDLGTRCLALLDWATEPEQCWEVCSAVAAALTELGRTAEAAALYDLACARSALPAVHMQSALGRASLHVRSCDDEQCDHEQARGWMNTAVAMARLVPESERQRLGLTLAESAAVVVECHVGDPAKALARLTRAVERDDQDAGAAAKTPHRALLLYQRAELLARMGSLEEALRAYSDAIAAVPEEAEPYFARARAHWRLGRHADALADFDTAIALSPPSPEAHLARGGLAIEAGDLRCAARDFSRVLELEPDHLDAYAHRASVFVELGELDRAAQDVADGLRLDPGRAELHCLRGVIALHSGRLEEAGEAFAETLRADPTLVGAWAHRAALRFARGDVDGATEDLTEALRIGGEDPAIRADRAILHERAGRLPEAISDYSQALEHPGADRAKLIYQRGRCFLRVGRPACARADLVRCLRLDDAVTAGLARAELERLGTASDDTLMRAGGDLAIRA